MLFFLVPFFCALQPAVSLLYADAQFVKVIKRCFLCPSLPPPHPSFNRNHPFFPRPACRYLISGPTPDDTTVSFQLSNNMLKWQTLRFFGWKLFSSYFSVWNIWFAFGRPAADQNMSASAWVSVYLSNFPFHSIHSLRDIYLYKTFSNSFTFEGEPQLRFKSKPQ